MWFPSCLPEENNKDRMFQVFISLSDQFLSVKCVSVVHISKAFKAFSAYTENVLNETENYTYNPSSSTSSAVIWRL